MGLRGMGPSLVLLLLLPALAIAAPILGAEQCKEMACTHGADIAPNPRWRGSRGPVHYLGTFKNVAGCEEACIGYKSKKGEVSKSFAYHQMEGGPKCVANKGCYRGQCFAITDDRWDPVPAPGIISGATGFSSSSLLNKAFIAATNFTHPTPEAPKVTPQLPGQTPAHLAPHRPHLPTPRHLPTPAYRPCGSSTDSPASPSHSVVSVHFQSPFQWAGRAPASGFAGGRKGHMRVADFVRGLGL